MEQAPKKFCKDCFHLEVLPDNGDRIDVERYLCKRYKQTTTFDIVTGKPSIHTNRVRAYEERKHPVFNWRETCGPEGKFWELK